MDGPVCRKCGRELVGAVGTRVRCPGCQTSQIVGGPVPTVSRGSARSGSFAPTPVIVSSPTPERPAQGLRPGDKISPLAITSLVFGIAPFFAAAAMNRGIADGDGLVFIVAPALAITAIVTGILGIKQVNDAPRTYRGKGLAITGMVLGIVFLGMLLLAVIIVAILCAAYFGSYASGTQASTAGAAAMMTNRHGAPASRWTPARIQDVFLAHHPRCDAFREDVVGDGSTRVCASCLALVPSAIMTFGVLRWLSPTSHLMPTLFALGLTLAILAQGLSIARWTRTRIRKIAGRSLVGIGLGTTLAALELGMWTPTERVGLFSSGMLLAILLIQPRRARLRDEAGRHEHGVSCSL